MAIMVRTVDSETNEPTEVYEKIILKDSYIDINGIYLTILQYNSIASREHHGKVQTYIDELHLKGQAEIAILYRAMVSELGENVANEVKRNNFAFINDNNLMKNKTVNSYLYKRHLLEQITSTTIYLKYSNADRYNKLFEACEKEFNIIGFNRDMHIIPSEFDKPLSVCKHVAQHNGERLEADEMYYIYKVFTKKRYLGDI